MLHHSGKIGVQVQRDRFQKKLPTFTEAKILAVLEVPKWFHKNGCFACAISIYVYHVIGLLVYTKALHWVPIFPGFESWNYHFCKMHGLFLSVVYQ